MTSTGFSGQIIRSMTSNYLENFLYILNTIWNETKLSTLISNVRISMQMIERKKSRSGNTCDCTALTGLLLVSIYIYREMMMDTPTPTIHIIVLGSWALR